MHHDEALRDKLTTYIEDAYAMENQIVEQLEKQVKETQKFPDIQARIAQHLEATKQHRERMEQRLGAYNKHPSTVKSALSNMMGNVAGALGGTRSDALAMTARDDYMVEHMEIAAYELLIATAQAFGDQETVGACEANLRDEVEMADWLEHHLPTTALLALKEDGIAIPEAQQQAATSAARSALQSARSLLPQDTQYPQEWTEPPATQPAPTV